MPDVIPRCLPFWGTGCFWGRAVILEASILPLDISNIDHIDLAKEISVVGDGWRAAMGNERGSPQLKEFVDPSPRKLGVGERKLCKFEPSP